MSNSPQISVIIHFLNAEAYLPQAIASVFRQTWTDWELILVDGGSTDQSVAIAHRYQAEHSEQVRVLAHPGPDILGIFSSRIWGAQDAKAPILAHLDADDEWHPQFLERHYQIYQSVYGTAPGMVYCPVIYWWEDPALAGQSYVQPMPPAGLHPPAELLLDFIRENYQSSAANSSVLIARQIILEAAALIGTANEGMVEDQYLWCFVILNYPVYVNPEPLARYRQWPGSTCAQGGNGKGERLRQQHLQWLPLYIAETYHGEDRDRLIQQVEALYQQEFSQPGGALVPAPSQALTTRLSTALQNRISPDTYQQIQRFYRQSRRVRVALQQAVMAEAADLQRRWKIVQARARMGLRVEPLSYRWGGDRGLPLHRYYLEQFLRQHASDIQGHCLEFNDPGYLEAFGQGVTTLDVLHLDDSNPQATLVADLTQPNSLPDNQFDCIICTHVLHVVFDLDRFVAELHRILKPGGVLLVAVPQVSMCDPGWHELWRFTSEGLNRVLTQAFAPERVTVQAYGNALTAAGELRGVVSHEFAPEELNYHDPRFALEVCARAVKAF